MPIGEITHGQVEEGTDAWNVMRIVNQAGAPVTRAQITDWDLSVWNKEDGTVVYSLSSQSPSDSTTFLYFDTLQSADGYWEDTDGYNARHFIRETDVASGTLKGGSSYQFEYGFNTSSFGRLTKRFIWDVQASRLV